MVFCMKKLFYISLLYLTFFSTGLAQVSQFVFITGEQTVGAGVLSGAITIQSQNSAGVSEAVTETTDLSFQSTSPTGKFVAGSLKPASKTMSKNTAKRTFYYLDSTPGSYMLTVKTIGRSNKKTFTLTQGIIITGGSNINAEVKTTPVPSVATTVIPFAQTLPLVVKSSPIPRKVLEKIPAKKQNETASSTVEKKEEIKESSDLAAVIYTAPPKVSALESFLWLPRKIWSVVRSVFQ